MKKTFEQQLNALIYLHLKVHISDRRLLQVLKKVDCFARTVVAPPEDMKKSASFEAVNSRGIEQLIYVLEELQTKAARMLLRTQPEFGTLVVIDKLSIDACLSTHRSVCVRPRTGRPDSETAPKKSTIHFGFDLANQNRKRSLALKEHFPGHYYFKDRECS